MYLLLLVIKIFIVISLYIGFTWNNETKLIKFIASKQKIKTFRIIKYFDKREERKLSRDFRNVEKK